LKRLTKKGMVLFLINQKRKFRNSFCARANQTNISIRDWTNKLGNCLKFAIIF